MVAITSSVKAVYRYVAQQVEENPIKIYAGIYLVGDAISTFNPEASFAWQAGAVLGVAANLNKCLFGRGGLPAQTGDFKITFRDFARALCATAAAPLMLATRESLAEFAQSFRAVSWHKTADKLARSRHFWRYPLDAGWVAYTVCGVAYASDALLLRDTPNVLQAVIGGTVLCGSVTGFLTDNNKLAGRLFATGTVAAIGSAVLDMNWSLAMSSCAYLYGAHLISKVSSHMQSEHTQREHSAIRQAKPQALIL